MKKSQRRLLLRTGCALALAASPMWAVSQTPPPAPAGGQAAPAPPAAPEPPPSAAEGGYLIGLSFGEQIHRIGITNEITVEDISRGVKEALAGKKLGPADQQHLQTFVKSVIDGITARNKAAAKTFLAKNGQEKGVKTTASGLEYKILVPGDSKAASPAATDTVSVQYRGKLLDGSEFDSSYSRGEPATFPVSNVIKGWQEALVLMKPGSKWQVFVPPELGYDANPRPGIPPGSLLIFEVELQGVKPPSAAKPPERPMPGNPGQSGPAGAPPASK